MEDEPGSKIPGNLEGILGAPQDGSLRPRRLRDPMTRSGAGKFSKHLQKFSPREPESSRARAAPGSTPEADPAATSHHPELIGGMRLRMMGGGAVPKARETRLPRVSTVQQHPMT